MGLNLVASRQGSPLNPWAKLLVGMAGLSLICAGCSRQESSSTPEPVSGSDPLKYATDFGDGGSFDGGVSSGSSKASFFFSGGGTDGDGTGDGASIGTSSLTKGLRHKNLDGTGISSLLPTDLGSEPALTPQDNLQVSQSLVDAVAFDSSPSPFSGDPSPGNLQINMPEDPSVTSAAPLPSVAWGGLALLCAIPLVTAPIGCRASSKFRQTTRPE